MSLRSLSVLLLLACSSLASAQGAPATNGARTAPRSRAPLTLGGRSVAQWVEYSLNADAHWLESVLKCFPDHEEDLAELARDKKARAPLRAAALDYLVRVEAPHARVRELAQSEGMAEALIAGLEERHARRYKQRLETLAVAGVREAYLPLTKTLRLAEFDTAYLAALAASGPEGFERVVAELVDPHSAETACIALGFSLHPETEERVFALLKEQARLARRTLNLPGALVEGLKHFEAERAWPVLRELLRRSPRLVPNGWLRAQAGELSDAMQAEILRAPLSPDQASPVLGAVAEHVRSPDLKQRYAAKLASLALPRRFGGNHLRALARLDPKLGKKALLAAQAQATGYLRTSLQSSEFLLFGTGSTSPNAQHVLYYAERHQPIAPHLLPSLAHTLESRSFVDRVRGLRALGQGGDKQSALAIRALLEREKDAGVRQIAERCLRELEARLRR